MKLTDDQLDSIVAAHLDDGDDILMLHARINDRRRKVVHQRVKEQQTNMVLHRLADDHREHVLKVIREEFHKPLTKDDCENSGADQLLLTVQECIKDGNLEDIVYALIRVARKSWAGNRLHMGPIEGVPVRQPGESL